jgi:DNA-binding XRE family transcriptional regulator
MATIYVDGKAQAAAVHRLMLLAFVGPAPTPRHRATFLDGDRTRLQLDNLAWLTPEECNQLRYLHGTYKQRPSYIFDGRVHYQCQRCRRWQIDSEFYVLSPRLSEQGNRLSTCGRQSECRKCSTVRRRIRRRIAKANGGAVPTLMEQILPLLQLMDGLPPTAAAPSPGERLAALRKAKGMSQKTLARAAGVHEHTVEVLERGQNLPRPKTLAKLAVVLCGSVPWGVVSTRNA